MFGIGKCALYTIHKSTQLLFSSFPIYNYLKRTNTSMTICFILRYIQMFYNLQVSTSAKYSGKNLIAESKIKQDKYKQTWSFELFDMITIGNFGMVFDLAYPTLNNICKLFAFARDNGIPKNYSLTFQIYDTCLHHTKPSKYLHFNDFPIGKNKSTVYHYTLSPPPNQPEYLSFGSFLIPLNWLWYNFASPILFVKAVCKYLLLAEKRKKCWEGG